jgi:hypothetical protein
MALVGCGCLTVGVAVAIVLVALNWPTINRTYKQASDWMEELRTVQAAVQAKTGTHDVTVLWRTEQRSPGRILVVRIANPKGLTVWPAEQEEEQAREIARFARASLRDPASAQTVEVALTRKAGVGHTVARSNVFRFSAADLGTLPGSPEPSGRPTGR